MDRAERRARDLAAELDEMRADQPRRAGRGARAARGQLVPAPRRPSHLVPQVPARGGPTRMDDEEERLMAVDKPTERAQEALAGAARVAEERGNQVIEPEHLLLALLDAREGVVGVPVLERAGADPDALRAATEAAIARRPQVSGETSGPQLSSAFRRVLRRADEEAETIGDEYISTEHLLLALAGGRAPAGARGAHVERRVSADDLLHALQAGARLAPRHRPEPRGQVPGARALRPRPHRGARERASSTRSSAATRRSAASSRCSRAAPRTTRC